MFYELMFPKVTYLYAGIMGVFYFLLSANVIRYRTKLKVGIGHGTDPACPLFRSVRIHSNFSEYVPFIILLMMMDEMTGRSAMFVHSFGIALIVSRVMHFVAITESHGGSKLRVLGAGTTFSVMLVLSFLLIIKGLQ